VPRDPAEVAEKPVDGADEGEPISAADLEEAS